MDEHDLAGPVGERISLARSLMLFDREVTREQFQQFLDDPDSEKCRIRSRGTMAVFGDNRRMRGDINCTRMSVVAVVLTTVIVVITDLDRAYTGFVLESQRPFIDVLHEMDSSLSAESGRSETALLD